MSIFCNPASRLGSTASNRSSLLLGLMGWGMFSLGLLGNPEPGISQNVQVARTRGRQLQPQRVELPAPTVEGAKRINPYTAEIVTQNQTLTLSGTAPAGTTLKLRFYAQRRRQELQPVVQPDGSWSIPLTVPLPEGRNELYLSATALKDNHRSSGLQLVIVVDRTLPTLQVQQFRNNQVAPLVEGSVLAVGDRLLGQVDGTGSRVRSLTYRMDEQSTETPIPVSTDGLFNEVLTARGLAPGRHRLTLTAIDAAGNQRIVSYPVITGSTSNQQRSANQLLIKLLQITGSNRKLAWTKQPDIVGYVVGSEKITHLEGRLLPRLISEAPGKRQGTQALADNHILFQDMTALLQPNGTFWLKENFLRTIDYANLDDGPYTLELRGQTADTAQFSQRLEFVLDRTSPEIQLSNIDGIAWDWGTRLQGSVHENLSEVQVDYQFVREKDRAVTSRGAFKVQGRRIDLLLPEFVKTNRMLEEEETYYLLLNAHDLAGNVESLKYTFFIPGDRRVIDDDVLTPAQLQELERRRRR
ncbi:hypothetical protein K9N68_38610 (plasmid) [Kovacikia minuta CCNUW1]|uniref:hypothetical protein n=1 Tax=Kovacikia minuta TaxID=2931930 RepID=UPI001CCCA49F|nr:hypothetical protein [Kovacikia minuta]UBF30096.1 hypothetical protein K9N68_38610 [Kovacikia minuta CCNUW1]